MHSWQGWGLKIHHTSSDYAYTILRPWQLGWWCCMRCLSMAAFTAFNIYWFVDINKFIEPMTSCHHQSLSYLLLQSFTAGHLILSDQSLYKVKKMFAVLLIRQCKVTFCSRNSLDPPSFNCSWDNIWQLGSNLVALGTNPFMTAVHQKVFLAPLEAKNGRSFFSFNTVFVP